MPDPVTSATATVDQAALEAWGRGVGTAVAAGELGPPLVIVLRGPLGAGKSVLARAIARGAGVVSPMPSPTYNLVFSYAGDGVRVHHLDLYRLDEPDDVWELGWQELGEGDQVVLIEWPERAEELLPPDRWEVRLAFVDDAASDAASRRTFEAHRRGESPPVPPVAGRDRKGGGA